MSEQTDFSWEVGMDGSSISSSRGMSKLQTGLAVFFIIFAAILTLVTPLAIHAQSSAASMSGTITDSTGAVIPDARIVLRNVDTNVEQSTVSGSAGAFSIVSIAPGRYSL